MTDSTPVKTHIPCKYCNSSDAGALYSDGHFHCFSCQTTDRNYTGPLLEEIMEHIDQAGTVIPLNAAQQPAEDSLRHLLEGLPGAALTDRKISASVVNKYGVRVDNVKYRHLYPYYDKNRRLVGVKSRYIKDKTFAWTGNGTSSLFGAQLFPSGGRAITICEGEIDTMAAHQMNGAKWPTVGIPSASAVKAVKDNLEYLNSFENIYLALDNDDAGRAATETIAHLFEPDKCKVVDLSPLKDVGEYLEQGKTESYTRRWWAAAPWTPAGIIRGSTLWEALIADDDAESVDYPYTGLQKMTYGMRKGEMVTITAGSGLGKSAVVKELMHHLLAVTDDNIGCMFLEESMKRSALGFLSITADKPFHLPDTEYTREELRAAFDKTLGTDRVFFYDAYGSNNLDNIIGRIRHMARALDCQWIVLDHLSIVVSSQESGDERKAIDEIVTKVRTLIQELGIGLILVSHLRRPQGQGHEDGAATSLSQLRGSAAIAQLSDMVIGLERNGQHENDVLRNTTRVRVLKNRFSGITGLATHLYYDKETGRLSEIDDPGEGTDIPIMDSSPLAELT
jgi:twinkle protein